MTPLYLQAYRWCSREFYIAAILDFVQISKGAIVIGSPLEKRHAFLDVTTGSTLLMAHSITHRAGLGYPFHRDVLDRMMQRVDI